LSRLQRFGWRAFLRDRQPTSPVNYSTWFRAHGVIYSPIEIETPLTPGQHFLLLPLDPEEKSRPIELERCLVLPDTPEIRAQLQRGIRENDTLRYPDPNATLFIPD
jgi:hypothetical protein